MTSVWQLVPARVEDWSVDDGDYNVTNGVDFLVTWNFRHIANAAMRVQIEQVCRQAGYEPPVICTPNELMEANNGRTTD